MRIYLCLQISVVWLVCLLVSVSVLSSSNEYDVLTPEDISITHHLNPLDGRLVVILSFIAFRSRLSLTLRPDGSIFHPTATVELVDANNNVESRFFVNRSGIFKGIANRDNKRRVRAVNVRDIWIIHILSRWELICVEPMRWYDRAVDSRKMIVYKGWFTDPTEFNFKTNPPSDMMQKAPQLSEMFGKQAPASGQSGHPASGQSGQTQERGGLKVKSKAIVSKPDGPRIDDSVQHLDTLNIHKDTDQQRKGLLLQNVDTLLKQKSEAYINSLRRRAEENNMDEFTSSTELTNRGSEVEETYGTRFSNTEESTGTKSPHRTVTAHSVTHTKTDEEGRAKRESCYATLRHGAEGSATHVGSTVTNTGHTKLPSQSKRDRREASDATTCELMAIVDYDYFSDFHSDYQEIIAALAIVYQYVDEIFRKTKLESSPNCGIAVKSFRIHTNYSTHGNAYNTRNPSLMTGKQLLDIVRASSNASVFYNYCLVHLNCKRRFSPSIAGMSYLAEPFGDYWSAGICGDYVDADQSSSPSNLLLTNLDNFSGVSLIEYSMTLVHEMGHSWGGKHDSEHTDCVESDVYIMNRYTVSKHHILTVGFSPCSVQQMSKILKERRERCFRARPRPQAHCGDGRVDWREDCDPNSSQTSGFQCCTRTCQFLNAAECLLSLNTTSDVPCKAGVLCARGYCLRGRCRRYRQDETLHHNRPTKQTVTQQLERHNFLPMQRDQTAASGCRNINTDRVSTISVVFTSVISYMLS